MSDLQTPENQSAPTVDAVREQSDAPSGRTKRGWLWLLIFGAVLGALAGVAGQHLWANLVQDAAPDAVQASVIDGRLNALEATLNQQDAERQELRALQQNLQRERSLLLLDRIDQQLNAGQQIWAMTGDGKPLNNALQTAVDSLQAQPGAPMQALRMAVGRDLATLKAAPVVDVPAALASLDALAASIDSLPLIQDQRVPAAPPAATVAAASEPTGWLEHAQRWLGDIGHEVWQALRGMVRVQRLDRAEPGLIAPEQKVFLQESLRLRLLDARHALITRNTTQYQQALTEARSWLEKYMDTGSPPVKAALDSLQQLSALNIAAAPALSQSAAALIQARAALAELPGNEENAVTGSATGENSQNTATAAAPSAAPSAVPQSVAAPPAAPKPVTAPAKAPAADSVPAAPPAPATSTTSQGSSQ